MEKELNYLNDDLQNIGKVTKNIKLFSKSIPILLIICTIIPLGKVLINGMMMYGILIKIDDFYEIYFYSLIVLLPLLGILFILFFSNLKKEGDHKFGQIVKEIQKIYESKEDKSERLPDEVYEQMDNFSEASTLPFFYKENGHAFYFLFFLIMFLWAVSITLY